MAGEFILNWSNDTLKTPITIYPTERNDTFCSLTLFGKGATLYGEGLQENLIRLMENFASDTPPINPTLGQIWYDSTDDVLKVFDGNSFVYQKTPTSPNSTPNIGDIYYSVPDSKLKVFTGNVWEDIVIGNDLANAIADLNNHIANEDLHLTPFQNLLLDGINSSITSNEINALDGITGNIQNQIDNHEQDYNLHLTVSQNLLLDGINSSITSNEINTLDGITGNIQNQIDNTGFPSGTKLVFPQASAPTGWTQDTTDDRILRIVSGAGGGTGGTDSPIAAHTHATSSHTLTIAEMPSHDHGIGYQGSAYHPPGVYSGQTGSPWTWRSTMEGGNSPHSHGNTQTAFAPKYIDSIIASKD